MFSPHLRSLFLFSFFLLFISCSKPPDNTLVVHTPADPEDLHPTNGASALRTEINLYIHSTLVKLDYETNTLMPCLAEALPLVGNNGLSYEYTLRKEAAWDDGSPITGDDVAFTTRANQCLLTNNPATKPLWENVKDIVVDEKNNRHFTVNMKRPYILNAWLWTDLPIMQETFYDPKKILRSYGFGQLTDSAFVNTHADLRSWAGDFNSGKYYADVAFISGAGPYRITAWNKGTSMTLERKKDHWTSHFPRNWCCQAGPDRIIFKVNNNSASTMLEFRNGLMDVSTMMDLAAFAELQKDEAFNKQYLVDLSDTYNYTYIAMNMRPDGVHHKKLFDDVTVRRAMALLTPYDQINKTMYDNKNTRMAGPVAASKNDFNPTLHPVVYDPEKAKALLAACGWKDTDNDQVLDKSIAGEKIKFEFRINYLSTQKQWEDIAKHLAESMKAAGISVVLNPVDYNTFVAAATSHDFDMSIGAWQNSALPEDFSQLWSQASWLSNGMNFTGFGTESSDALIDSVNSSTSDLSRKALSMRFQQLVYDQQPYIFLFAQKRRVVVSRKWGHVKLYPEHPGLLLNTLTLKK